ncbi:PASTA domain-containing protein [Flavobacterium rhizosphaerae]|uniref:PASTA domain-containing protein n=1 Tax=Flavobacterium rhizosphaerae TaxID=3163298 RepID=A0ABW8YRX2_9FLAO
MSLKDFLKSRVFLIQIAIALGIVIVVIFITLRWMAFTTNHGEEIIVPNLSKMTVEKAAETLEGLDLDYEVIDTVDFNADFAPYTVTEQDPFPSVGVKEGRKIYLKVNAGKYASIPVPDLMQKTHRQAILMLKSRGLEEGEITYEPYLAKDVVLEMKYKGRTLRPGDKVSKASKIDLVLGDGKTGYSEDTETDPATGIDENSDKEGDTE